MNIDKNGWREYMSLLSKAADIKINSIETLKQALKSRIEFFNSCGCKASDHGLDYIVYNKCSQSSLQKIMKKALRGKAITPDEADAFKTDIVLFCAKEYARLGWVMQIHYNCLRNTNSKMFKALGADTGFDCVGPNCAGGKLTALLDDLNSTDQLPKTVIYSLDANDNEFIDTVIGAFQGTEVAGKILAATPMGRFGESNELEGGLLFLLNNQAASFITGIVLPIDGGFSAYSEV